MFKQIYHISSTLFLKTIKYHKDYLFIIAKYMGCYNSPLLRRILSSKFSKRYNSNKIIHNIIALKLIYSLINQDRYTHHYLVQSSPYFFLLSLLFSYYLQIFSHLTSILTQNISLLIFFDFNTEKTYYNIFQNYLRPITHTS